MAPIPVHDRCAGGSIAFQPRELPPADVVEIDPDRHRDRQLDTEVDSTRDRAAADSLQRERPAIGGRSASRIDFARPSATASARIDLNDLTDDPGARVFDPKAKALRVR